MATTVPLLGSPGVALTTTDVHDDDIEESKDDALDDIAVKAYSMETAAVPKPVMVLVIVGIVVHILCPWVMIWILSVKGHVALPESLEEVWARDPLLKTVTVNAAILFNPTVGMLFFQWAIRRYGWALVAKRDPERKISVFQVSLLVACKFVTSTWELTQIGDWGRETKRLSVVVLFFVYSTAFFTSAGAIAGLVYPRQFKQTEPLRGEELDVMGECTMWLGSVRLDAESSCRWKSTRNLQNGTCRSESQISEILNSRRRNVLDINSNATLRSFPKSFGIDEGVTFLGSPRGILPLGLNGSPASGALSTPNSPFPDRMMRMGLRLYNYTLYQQGLECKVDCVYDVTSPVVMQSTSEGPMFLNYSGACDSTAGLEAVLNGVQSYRAVNTNTTLGFWACKRPASTFYPDLTYFIYLRGRLPEIDSPANVTCALSSLRPAIFPVTYSPVARHFAVGDKTTQEDMTRDPSQDTSFVEDVLAGLGNFIQEEQSRLSSPFVDLMASLGAGADTPPGRQVDTYLRFLEEMILKALEYEAMYMRLIYSAAANRPTMCTRNVTGNATFLVMGWSDEELYWKASALVPMTLANLVSCAVVLITFHMLSSQKTSITTKDPLLVESILSASVVSGDGGTRSEKVEWGDEVVYAKSVQSQDL